MFTSTNDTQKQQQPLLAALNDTNEHRHDIEISLRLWLTPITWNNANVAANLLQGVYLASLFYLWTKLYI